MVQVPVQIENEWGEVTTVLIEVPIQITTLIDESDDEELPDPIGYTELEGAGFENSEEVHIEEGGYEGFVIQLPIQIQTLVDESDDEELPDPIGKEQVVITIQSPKHMGKASLEPEISTVVTWFSPPVLINANTFNAD